MSAHLAASAFDHHLEAGAFGLLRGGRTGAQRDGDFLDAAVAQVLRMGMALAAIADDGDLLVGDQVEIGIGDRNRRSLLLLPSLIVPPAEAGASLRSRRVRSGPCLRGTASRSMSSQAPRARASCRRRRCGRPRPARARASARRSCRSCRAPGHFEDEARGRRVDHLGAEDVGEAQRLDPVSPVPATLISASSRSTCAPSSVRSVTLCTGTSRSSWADLVDHGGRPDGDDGDAADRVVLGDVGHGQAVDIVAARGEQAGDPRARMPASLST